MSRQVLEGAWEDILLHADEFSGKRVRITVIEEEEMARPNEAMLSALREVAAIQSGMRPTSEDSDGRSAGRKDVWPQLQRIVLEQSW